MTLIVVLTYRNGVAMACDSRITYGEAPLMREEPREIESLGNNIALIGTGMLGAIDAVTNGLKSTLGTYKSLDLKDVVDKCEDIMWSFHKKYKERFDEETEFPTLVLASYNKIYRIYENGFAEEEKNYLCEGSGRPYGEYILQQRFKPNLDEKEAKELVAYTIDQTSKIDPNVGGKICMVVIDKDGFRRISDEKISEILEGLEITAIVLEKEIQKIAGEIVEKRRWINSTFNNKFGFELFEQNEFAISDFQKSCRNEADFTNRITALALLIDGIRVSKLDKQLSTHPTGSINVLEAFLKEKYPNFNHNLIVNLRDIMTLRSKKMPIHEDDPKLIKVILRWEYKIPPNWSSLWKQALTRYKESLSELEKILS